MPPTPKHADNPESNPYHAMNLFTLTNKLNINELLFQGPRHRLEITDRDAEDVIKIGDMSTDDEDKVHAQMKNYEHKIDDLMNEVGTLKSEVRMPIC